MERLIIEPITKTIVTDGDFKRFSPSGRIQEKNFPGWEKSGQMDKLFSRYQNLGICKNLDNLAITVHGPII